MSKREVRTFDTFRFYDPEIVRCVETEVGATYGQDRDPSILGLPADARPIKFHCRVLLRSQRNRVLEIAEPKTQLVAAFRFGILEISDIPDDRGGFSRWSPQRTKADAQIDDRAMDALEELGFGDVDFWEIGGVVVGHSFLARDAQLYCPLQPSSQQVWATSRSRFLAAQKTEDETQTDG